MEQLKVQVKGHELDAYVIPCGPCNIVMIASEKVLVGCGAFDVDVLMKFDYPAVTVRSADGGRLASVNDVLNGIATKINGKAQEKGVTDTMTGRQVLELLL